MGRYWEGNGSIKTETYQPSRRSRRRYWLVQTELLWSHWPLAAFQCTREERFEVATRNDRRMGGGFSFSLILWSVAYIFIRSITYVYLYETNFSQFFLCIVLFPRKWMFTMDGQSYDFTGLLSRSITKALLYESKEIFSLEGFDKKKLQIGMRKIRHCFV